MPIVASLVISPRSGVLTSMEGGYVSTPTALFIYQQGLAIRRLPVSSLAHVRQPVRCGQGSAPSLVRLLQSALNLSMRRGGLMLNAVAGRAPGRRSASGNE